MRTFLTLLLLNFTQTILSQENTMYWWHSGEGANFGDHLSSVIVERILGRPVAYRSLDSSKKILLGAGSILHYARNGDVIWGSGFREDPLQENRFSKLDVRAVRGPKTRQFLIKKGIACPKVYGDPAILMAYLFPEFKRKEPTLEYIIIPNIGEMSCFSEYKNVILPTLYWEEIVKKILDSKLVISSSLHGLIVAESFGVPARLLKMTWIEPLLKYQDYYESTGRTQFKYATSVQEALLLGGEKPALLSITPLLESFPWDYFGEPKP